MINSKIFDRVVGAMKIQTTVVVSSAPDICGASGKSMNGNLHAISLNIKKLLIKLLNILLLLQIYFHNNLETRFKFRISGNLEVNNIRT